MSGWDWGGLPIRTWGILPNPGQAVLRYRRPTRLRAFLTGGRPLAELHHDDAARLPVDEREARDLARVEARRHDPDDVLRAADRRPVDRDDRVAADVDTETAERLRARSRPEARRGGAASGEDGVDQCAPRSRVPEVPRDRRGEILRLDPEVRVVDSARLEDLVQRTAGRVDRDRKADALEARAPARRLDLGVDPDHAAVRVE